VSKRADAIRAKLAEHGNRRRDALSTADSEKEEILKLAPRALREGLTVKELAELGSVSRPTLYARLGLGSDRESRRAK
jgi:hypothetical protein